MSNKSFKGTWILYFCCFVFSLLLFSSGPIVVAMGTLHKYQELVYRYNKYKDVPGASEFHVVNIDLDMRRNGKLPMHCRGPNSPAFPRHWSYRRGIFLEEIESRILSKTSSEQHRTKSVLRKKRRQWGIRLVLDNSSSHKMWVSASWVRNLQWKESEFL